MARGSPGSPHFAIGNAQVKFLNDALALFSISEVMPVHYLFFTCASVIGSMVMFQEWEMTRDEYGVIRWCSPPPSLPDAFCPFALVPLASEFLLTSLCPGGSSTSS